ncbi:DNA-binding protein WhiA [Brevibacillus daliensis]|uniref:DNA-binding protein WhiA n=1 Tax=Brevibacillus daliensis TaxID=2892995 RepID=UPI001E5D7F69|nr:DNA-binding protein WhiA [Brevibacillus daliensis]
MSFAALTKKELTMIEGKTCCNRAELAALIRMNGTIQFGTGKFVLDITTENAAIARRIYSLVKEIFQIHAELLVRKKMRLKKNNVYIVRLPHRAMEILEDLRIMDKSLDFYPGISPDLIENECCARAFLRGAFLAGGSVNHPEASSYHLEIFSSYQDYCEALTELANRYYLNAKCIERKKGFVMYIKEGEKITDFLSVIGAHQALLYFEDVRIVKDMRNSVNRLHNCEIANINKTVNAATRQMESIQLIEKVMGLENLPPRLREVAEIRLQNPDINLKELGEMIPSGPVSKSGINHRLRKINEIADNLREKQN